MKSKHSTGLVDSESLMALSSEDHQTHIPFRERITCSIADAVVASGIGRTGLYELLQSGVIKSRKHGRRRLVHVASLVNYLDH
ncbi:MAG TPA: helix-turn-helix domain-containing protein [Terriglobales bacterium]|nr:helix-turn-helix domain-containing protein [Terriglobales bacterium]